MAGMSTVDLWIKMHMSGDAQVRQQAARTGKAFDQLAAKQRQASLAIPAGTANPEKFLETSQAVQRMSATYSAALSSTGRFQVVQQKINNSSDQFISRLARQKIGLREVVTNLGQVREGMHHHMKIQKMMFTSFGKDKQGNLLGVSALPNALSDDAFRKLEKFRLQMGYLGQVTNSVGTSMINWGKNTQWAGRQLMVGFTVPLMLFGGMTGKLAFDVEQDINRIIKVYDTMDYSHMHVTDAMMAREKELQRVRQDSWTTATNAAKKFGVASTDTLGITAELAATGVRGSDLQQQTMETLRFATLGELDYQVALEASVALQTILGQSNKELAASFNYLNAVENETSLSMQDFAQAIPIAMGALKSTGGTLEDLGLLMVSMKERGIVASEGANALETAVARLAKPTKQTQAVFEKFTGVTLAQLTEKTGGNLVKMFNEIYDATAQLSNADRATVLAQLFGANQYTRLLAAMEGVSKANDGVGQSARAMAVAQQDAATLANKAASEIEKITNSNAMKIKRQWEFIRTELAYVGEQFLDVASKVIQVAGSFVEWFNKLGDGTKSWIVAGAAISGAAAALLMFIGLIGNFIGQGVNMAAGLMKFVGTGQLLTQTQAATAKAIERANKVFRMQGQEVDSLKKDYDALRASILATAMAEGDLGVVDQMHRAEAGAQVPGLMNMTPRQRASLARQRANEHFKEQGIDFRTKKGKNVVKKMGYGNADTLRFSLYDQFYREQEAFVQTESKLISVVKDQNAQLENRNRVIRRGVTYATTLIGAFSLMTFSSNETAQNIGQFAMVAGFAVPVLYDTLKVMAAIALKAKKWISLQAVLNFMINGTQQAMAGTMKVWRFIIAHPIGVGIAAAAGAAYVLYRNIKKTREENKKLATDVDTLGDIFGFTPKLPGRDKESGQGSSLAEEAQALNREYPKLAENIRDAAEQSEKFKRASVLGIRAFNAGASIDEARRVTAAALVAAQGYTSEQANAIVLQYKFDPENVEQVSAAVVQQIQTGLEKTEIDTSSWWRKILYGPGALQSGMESIARIGDLMGKDLDFKTAQLDPAVIQGIKEVTLSISTLVDSKKIIDANTQMTDFLTATSEGLAKMDENRRDVYSQRMFTGIMAEYGISQEKSIKYWNELDDKAKKNIYTISGIGKAFKDITGEQNAYIRQLELSDRILREERSLRSTILNSMEGYTRAQSDAVFNLLDGRKLTQDQVELIYQLASKNLDIANYLRIQNDFRGKNIQQLTAEQKAEKKKAAIQKASDDARKAMDRRHKAEQDALDKRFEKRKRALQDEEDLRRQMFENELTRLQRLKDAQQSEIDYRMALASGNLDQASKIQADATYQNTVNSIEDQDKREQEAFEKAMQRLEDAEKRAKDALERRQQREKDALDARVAAEVSAADKVNDAWNKPRPVSPEVKKAFDRRLKDIENQAIAKSKAGASGIDNTYGKFREEINKYSSNAQKTFGVLSKNSINSASKTVKGLNDAIMKDLGNYSNKVSKEIQWNKIAKDTATAQVRNTWNMSLPEFIKWAGVSARHTGGVVGDGLGGGSRVGYPASASPYPSEQLILAKKGEYVMSKQAVRNIGVETLDSMNSGLARGFDGRLYDVNDGVGMANKPMTTSVMSNIFSAGNQKVIKAAGDAASMNNIKGTTALGKDAIAWAKTQMKKPIRDWTKYCLAFVRTAFGAPAGTPDANTGWAKAKYKHPFQGAKKIPAGVPIWWKYAPHGHTAISLGNGKMITTGFKKKVSSIANIGKVGGTMPAGWSEDVNGKRVWKRSDVINASNSGTPLRTGGDIMFDNVPAILHKNETVLTAPLSRKLKEGINEMANTTNKSYGDIIVNVNGSVNDDNVRQLAMEIKKELDREEARYGIKR